MDEERRLGRTIRELRKKRKLNQTERAEKADVSLMTISRIERGEHDPHLRTLKRNAEGLDVRHIKSMRMAGYFEDDEDIDVRG
jgi:transcriptional regulator with XRE-family HTH domain